MSPCLQKAGGKGPLLVPAEAPQVLLCYLYLDCSAGVICKCQECEGGGGDPTEVQEGFFPLEYKPAGWPRPERRCRLQALLSLSRVGVKSCFSDSTIWRGSPSWLTAGGVCLSFKKFGKIYVVQGLCEATPQPCSSRVFHPRTFNLTDWAVLSECDVVYN